MGGKIAVTKQAYDTEHTTISELKNREILNVDVKKQQRSIQETNYLLAPCSSAERRKTNSGVMRLFGSVLYSRTQKKSVLFLSISDLIISV